MEATTTTTARPDLGAMKLSDLIDLAVRDCQACEADPGILLRMGDWHAPQVRADGVCLVCMAGAVMDQTLRVRRDEYVVPSAKRFTPGETRALRAIDGVRRGLIENALREMRIRPVYEDLRLSDKQWAALDLAQSIIFAKFNKENDCADWSAYTLAAQTLREVGL